MSYTANSWNSGFTADVRISNTGSSTINGWTLSYNLPSGQQITSSWNATVNQSGSTVTARNIDWNGTIAPGTRIRVTGTTSAFRGLLQINAGDLASYEIVSQGNTLPTPPTVTLAEIAASGEQYEGRVVRVPDRLDDIGPKHQVRYVRGGDDDALRARQALCLARGVEALDLVVGAANRLNIAALVHGAGDRQRDVNRRGGGPLLQRRTFLRRGHGGLRLGR